MNAVTDHVDRDIACIRAWQSHGGLDAVTAAVLRLWEGQVWKLRGHATWADMFTAEIGEPLRLSRANRKRIHEQLSRGGMSSRAIAVVTGASYTTAQRDEIKTGANAPVSSSAPEALDSVPQPVPTTGLDGHRRVTDPAQSQALTARIVALREADPTPTWSEIGEAVGLTSGAAWDRYANHRRKHPREAEPPPPPPIQLPTPARIESLADSGMTSKQIAAEIGVSVERVRGLANRDGIRIAGDINRGRGGAKTIDMIPSITNWLAQITAVLDAGDAFIDLDGITTDQAAEWAHQLNQITARLRAVTRKFQQQSQAERQAHHGRA